MIGGSGVSNSASGIWNGNIIVTGGPSTTTNSGILERQRSIE